MPRYRLIPGFESLEDGDYGWNDILGDGEPLADAINKKIISQIEGEKNISENLKKLFEKTENAFDPDIDIRSVHYSIPNPWAMAYFFSYICIEASYRKVFAWLLFNFFYDLYYGQVVLETIRVSAINEDDPFRLFLDMAPGFIVFKDNNNDDIIALFKNTGSKEVIGGLSKKSLIWLSSVNYKTKKPEFDPGSRTFKENPKNKPVLRLIRYVMNKRLPLANGFWVNPDLDIIQNEITPFDDNEVNNSLESIIDPMTSIADEDKSFFSWMFKVKEEGEKHKYYFRFAKKIIVSQTILEKETNIFGEHSIRISDELIKQNKKDVQYGQIPVELIEDYIEDYIVRIESPNNEFNEEHFRYVKLLQGNNGVYLYPLKENSIKSNLWPWPENNNCQLLISSELENTVVFQFKLFKDKVERLQLTKNLEVLHAENDIAFNLWPPFQSKFSENFLRLEMNTHLAGDLVRFYDENGKLTQPENSFDTSISVDKFKLYKFDNLRFPFCMQFVLQKGEQKSRGLLGILAKEKQSGRGKLEAAIDFGSSHTVVIFKEDKEESNLETLSLKSGSIFWPPSVEKSHGYHHSNFIPDKILTAPPDLEEDYQKNSDRTWIPIRTMWRPEPSRVNEPIQSKQEKFLVEGSIPLFYNPRYFFGAIQYDIKWSDNYNLLQYFLSSLLRITLVEAEIMGFRGKLVIKWSKPDIKDFKDVGFWTSDDYINFFKKDKDVLKQSIEVKRKNGYSEAIASSKYFTQFFPEFVKGSYNWVMVDIGGGTSDLSFFTGKSTDRHDCVRFAGDDLSGIIKDDVWFALNYVREYKCDIHDPIPRTIKFDDLLRFWPAVSDNWKNKIKFVKEALKSNQYKETMKVKGDYSLFCERIHLFYSGIIYYIGLHLRKCIPKNKIKAVTMGGNGIKFLYFLEENLDNISSSGSKFKNLFVKMIQGAQGIAYENKELKILFSKEPKFEVAYGMLHYTEVNERNETKKDFKSIHGIGNNRQKINCLDTFPPGSYEHKFEESREDDFDYAEFIKFLEIFYTSVSSIRGSKFSSIFNDKFKTRFKNFLENDKNKRLKTPLFFIALKIWMEILEPGDENDEVNQESTSKSREPQSSINKTKQQIRGHIIGNNKIEADDNGPFIILLDEDLDKAEVYLGKYENAKFEPAIDQKLSTFFKIEYENIGYYQLRNPAIIKWNKENNCGELQVPGLVWR